MKRLLLVALLLSAVACSSKETDPESPATQSLATAHPDTAKTVMDAQRKEIDALKNKHAQEQAGQDRDRRDDAVHKQTQAWGDFVVDELRDVRARYTAQKNYVLVLEESHKRMEQEFGLCDAEMRLEICHIALRMAHGKPLDGDVVKLIRSMLLFREPLKKYAESIANDRPPPQLAPHVKHVGVQISSILEALGHIQELREARALYQQSSDDMKYWTDQANWLLRMRGSLLTRDYDGVILSCNLSIQSAPQYAAPYFFRGVAYWEKGDKQRATVDFQQTVRLYPAAAPSIRAFN